MTKLVFAGHDTFHCRNFWLKKGLDLLWSENQFSKESVITLGVGGNMVNAIKYWLKSFGLTDRNYVPAELSKLLFKDDGYDPYIEDIGTVWLLHYLLVKEKYASIYSLVFNEFRRKRVEFTREHLLSFLEQKCISTETHFSPNSLKKDIGVLVNNYTRPDKVKSVEDDFVGLLYELNLIQKLEKYSKSQWYSIQNTQRPELPHEIILFCMLDRFEGQTISFNDLLNGRDSVGTVFALSERGLMDKIKQILESYHNQIVFTDDGGVRVMQFKNVIDKWDVLKNYYE